MRVVKKTIKHLKVIFKDNEVYIAYYIMRSDGDGDLCAVIENGESTYEELALPLMKAVEYALSNSLEDWFKVEHGECDFPDVWDLTSGKVTEE